MARRAAVTGALVTFGIVSMHTKTEYGYIEQCGPKQRDTESSLPHGVHPVARFVEKPDLATAQAYVESGRYPWNSGMFLFRASLLGPVNTNCHPGT